VIGAPWVGAQGDHDAIVRAPWPAPGVGHNLHWGLSFRPFHDGSSRKLRLFYPREVERFLEKLDFHGLAAEQTFQLAYPPFQFTYLEHFPFLG
jgi:hypothetical protein